MIERKISCDVCKREKGLTNHWYLVNCTDSPNLPTEVDSDTIPFWKPSVLLLPFSRADAVDIDQGSHACSHECAHKLIDRWMAKIEAKVTA
jgi:hypothetical protein